MLKIGELEGLQVIAGLGPITNNYVVVSTREHVRSMSDAAEQDISLTSQISSIRDWLEAEGRGAVLMTEHGKVPVCIDPSQTEHEAHCFHAHFLCFTTNIDIRDLVSTYFGQARTFRSLEEALTAERELDPYMSVSPSSADCTVYSRPLHAPRQLSRTLLAYRLRTPELSDWRSSPNRPIAEGIAARLRGSFARRFRNG